VRNFFSKIGESGKYLLRSSIEISRMIEVLAALANTAAVSSKKNDLWFIKDPLISFSIMNSLPSKKV
jgi:hypothetical protein